MRIYRYIICLFVFLLCPQHTSGQYLRDIFQEVKPSVVVVRTIERDFALAEGGSVRSKGLGSGVLISTDGKVLTASHVVQTADKVGVEFPSGHFSQAKIVASVPPGDVALLELEDPPDDVQPAVMGNSDEAFVGDQVFVVGAPYGLSHTLTVGHISARHAPNKVAGNLTGVELFQTDAAINTGNSGGPMFNLKGEVIGIVSHILSRSGGFEGLGFAVTSKAAKKLVMEGLSFWSGLEGYLLTDELAKILNVPQPAGVLVQRVAAQSPAADLGLQWGKYQAQIQGEMLLLGGDIILEAAGITVTGDGQDFERIQQAIANKIAVGDMSVRVLREGQVIKLSMNR